MGGPIGGEEADKTGKGTGREIIWHFAQAFSSQMYKISPHTNIKQNI